MPDSNTRRVKVGDVYEWKTGSGSVVFVVLGINEHFRIKLHVMLNTTDLNLRSANNFSYIAESRMIAEAEIIAEL